MLSSMTGFSNINEIFNQYKINIEIKSLNNKYLVINYKINEELQILEQKIYDLITKKINRGTIELKIKVDKIDNKDDINSFNINYNLLNKLIDINNDIINKNPKIIPINVSSLIKFPNIIIKNNEIIRPLLNKIIDLTNIAIKQLESNKKNEGEKLAQNILNKINKLELIVQQITTKISKYIQQHHEKLKKRIKNALLEIEQPRLQQEFVYFIQKYDIDEELKRIEILLQDLKTGIINNNFKPIGKKLDFIIQELNRETNTIASKSISIEITQLSIKIKVLLEQIREQIQNIE